jgi:arsenite methyltransferase
MQNVKPDYGVDAPAVLRNLFLFGVLCVVCGLLLPRDLHFGQNIVRLKASFLWTGGFSLLEACSYLFYVRRGKMLHRDFMLGLHRWSGAERVLDIGCGRGLLLVGAAKRLSSGKATGIDLWSNVDMGGNSPDATLRNIEIEGVTDRCEVLSAAAQAMPFADGAFDVVMSNLCLHNIADAAVRQQALRETVRVLRPGGVALISDFKKTGEYVKAFAAAGLTVEKRRGNPLHTFPPLAVVVARKPG